MILTKVFRCPDCGNILTQHGKFFYCGNCGATHEFKVEYKEGWK